METDELRRRVGIILDAEEREPRDWTQVERLTDQLQQHLQADPDAECPEIVYHYLDDADIRARDEVYAGQQREPVRRFVETGEYPDSTPVPWWSCALVLALVGGLLLWLLL